MVTDTERRPAVQFALEGGVVTLTLDQPETRNALTPELLSGLAEGVARAAATPGARVVVLSHTGPAFCAGADLREGAGSTAGAAAVGGLGALLAAIQDLPMPTVARIGGHCLGGGLGLAAACDLSVASSDVVLGFSEVRLGVAPAIISVVCLPKLRQADALELFLTGERIPAARAAEVGLVTRVVPPDELDSTTGALIASLLAGGPEALRVAKSLVYRVPGQPRDEAFEWAAQISGRLFASSEAAEGRTAFREKRRPAWAPPAGAAGEPARTRGTTS